MAMAIASCIGRCWSRQRAGAYGVPMESGEPKRFCNGNSGVHVLAAWSHYKKMAIDKIAEFFEAISMNFFLIVAEIEAVKSSMKSGCDNVEFGVGGVI